MRITGRGAVAPSFALLLAGCAVGPDYSKPEMAAPARYLTQTAIEGRAVSAAADPADAWWRSFDDPLLDALIRKALDQNLDLAQATARVSQARAGVRFASAALLPSGRISGDASASHLSRESLTGRLTSSGGDRNVEQYQGNVEAGWEIDLFGGLRRDREAAVAEYQASEAGVGAARLSVAAEVADNYMLVRGLQSRIAVAVDQIAAQKRLLEIVRLQYDKGIAAELALRQAEGAFAEVSSSLPVLRSALAAALNSIDVLEGEQPGTNRISLETPSSVPAAPRIGNVGSPADLLRRRPDLVIAERRLAASNAQIGSAMAEYYPKFSLGGLLGTSTTIAGNLLTSPANQAQGILGLRWRLFDFGRVDADIKRAKGRNAEALAAYRLSVLRASEDVENAFSNLLEREEQAGVLSGGVAALQKAQRASLAAYKGGMVSLIEVLDADMRLLRTRDALVQSRVEASRAAIASFRALGGGWSADSRLALTSLSPDAQPTVKR